MKPLTQRSRPCRRTMRARLARIAKLIEEKDLERVGEPHVKHIEGRLWEMRLKGRSGIARALYVRAWAAGW